MTNDETKALRELSDKIDEMEQCFALIAGRVLLKDGAGAARAVTELADACVAARKILDGILPKD